MKGKKGRVAACVVAMQLCAPSVASAQSGLSTEAQVLTSVTYAVAISTSIATVAVFGATVLSPMIFTTSVGQEVVKEEPVALMEYLRAHEHGLREAVTMGSGVVFDDFAHRFELDARERVAMARVMRGKRAELLELARPEALTGERALEFALTLASAMREDEVLYGVLERYGKVSH